MRKRIVFIAICVLMALSLALPVLANSKSYSWTMDKRYVNGKDNGITHSMTAGTLTHTGLVWQYGKQLNPVGPFPVNIEVWQDKLFDKKICTATLTPPTTTNSKKSFTKGCGSIVAGSYYIVVWKVEEDGRFDKGTGTLKTP